MTEQPETIQGEIATYVEDLTAARHKICNYQVGIPLETKLFQESQSVVENIDRVMDTLKTPNLSDQVDLSKIIEISEAVEDAKTSAARILSRPKTK